MKMDDDDDDELGEGPNVAPPNALDLVVRLPKADPADAVPNAEGLDELVAKPEKAELAKGAVGGAGAVGGENTVCAEEAAGAGGRPKLFVSHSVALFATGGGCGGSGAESSSISVISSVIVAGLSM